MAREERRHYARIDAHIEVSFPTPEAYVVEYTKNISKGGIFVKTGRLPDPNAVVELKLKFPGVAEEISILARVARTVAVSDPTRPGQHLYGVGFYFIEWSMRAKAVFEGYYRQLEQQKSASPAAKGKKPARAAKKKPAIADDAD